MNRKVFILILSFSNMKGKEIKPLGVIKRELGKLKIVGTHLTLLDTGALIDLQRAIESQRGDETLSEYISSLREGGSILVAPLTFTEISRHASMKKNRNRREISYEGLGLACMYHTEFLSALASLDLPTHDLQRLRNRLLVYGPVYASLGGSDGASETDLELLCRAADFSTIPDLVKKDYHKPVVILSSDAHLVEGTGLLRAEQYPVHCISTRSAK